MSKLVIFGLGYTARAFARRMAARGWRVHGTCRSAEQTGILAAQGFKVSVFTGEEPSGKVREALHQATHVLVSIAPAPAGDPVHAHFAKNIAGAKNLEWIGYLSTVGVYGDHGGAWVDEDSTLKPISERSIIRVAAEQAWLNFGVQNVKCVQLFRLAGIYGPGRGPLEKVRQGEARRIVKPGQVFNRIHVEDIAIVLEASIARPRAGGVYNVSDDEPAPPQEVVAYAAQVLGVDAPPEVAFEDAGLSPMGRSFYGENKRVSNARIKKELGVKLTYPTYREGIGFEAAAPGGRDRHGG